MSTKSVKITNGKILNYKISASGYKTIHGSQLITADTAINKNMIAESDPNGVYSLGDRIANMATFVCYFNSINPDTSAQQTYAVFVLDAAYRGVNVKCFPYSGNYLPLHQYDALTATESATYNMDVIANNYDISNFPAFKMCQDIVLPDLNITAKLPNFYELKQIWGGNRNTTDALAFRQALDALDPTVSDHTHQSLAEWDSYNSSRLWTSTQLANDRFFTVKSNGDSSYGYSNDVYSFTPIFEIPVN